MVETSIIESIRAKIYRLISENEVLKAERSELMEGNDRLKAENRELQEKITTLEKRIKVLELKDGISGTTDGEDAKLARARINHLMREIDKCIALMNRG